MVDAHAYRWVQLSKELAKQGHSVNVITSRIQSVQNIEALNGVSIKRIGIIASNNVPESAEAAEKNKNKVITRSLSIKRLLIRAYSSFYWPDPLWHWLPSLIVELYKRRKIRYDYVISYYPCFAAHLGGFVFKLLRGTMDSKWIVDYGDPFSVSTEWPPNNYAIYRGINKWIEGVVFSYCDTFAVMNAETRGRYEALFGKHNKLVTIPHLAPRIKPVEVLPKACTVILRYIGSFHRQVRDHSLLFELAGILEKSEKIKYQIEIYGPTEYWTGIDIPANIHILGKVARDTALQLLSSADVLINVNNTTDLMTPSKIIEYIATRRPIINIGGHELRGYRPLQRYAEHGMCLSFSGTNARNTIYVIERFIEESTRKPSMSDSELYTCLAGHTASEILDAYGIIEHNDCG